MEEDRRGETPGCDANPRPIGVTAAAIASSSVPDATRTPTFIKSGTLVCSDRGIANTARPT
jgi:hypothetical protein